MSLPVAPDALREALVRNFDMTPEDASEIAEVVLERFASGREVDDDTLDPDIRSVFYTLESKRMLSFRRIEYVREDGDRRRGFLWRLRPDAFEGRPLPVHELEEDVYAALPPAAWRHAS